MYEWMNHGQYGNGSGFNGGYVTRDHFGNTLDSNGRQVHRSW